jgi:hypothetical protein
MKDNNTANNKNRQILTGKKYPSRNLILKIIQLYTFLNNQEVITPKQIARKMLDLDIADIII